MELLLVSEVFKAVLKYGSTQWYSIGLKMGFTDPQIKACTHDMPSLSSKLEAIIEMKVRECGAQATGECVLSACERIPQPIIGSVLDEMSERGRLEGECAVADYL